MSPDSRTDLELMQLLGSGRDEAFAALVERHQRALVNFFRRLGADDGSAEDCAQETFLRLFRYRDRYRTSAPFAAFLYTLARHAWVDWLRRVRRRVFTQDGDIEDAAAPVRLSAEDRLDVQAAVRALPERLRWVIVLSVNEGLSYAQVAEVLDIPVGTVKSRMFHAIRALREILHARLE